MGNRSSESKTVQVPPIAPFLSAPVPFGSPQYLLLQMLGQGAFGRAYVAVLKRDLNLADSAELPSCQECFMRAPKHYVIKRFRGDLDQDEAEGKSDDEKAELIERKRAMFIDERRSAAWIKAAVGDHPNLVSYKHDIPDPTTGTDAMVFEFCNCGDIRRLVKGCKDKSGKLIHLTLFEILHIGVQLANGLAALAEAKIVHRDLALRNVFVHCNPVGDLVLKIGDFGLCVDIGDGKREDERVKFGLHEPAAFKGFDKYDEKSDVYQLGLMLYELLSLIDLSQNTLYQLNTTSLAEARVLVAGSVEGLGTIRADYKDVANLVRDMISSDSAKRPTARNVFHRLNDALARIPPKGPCSRCGWSNVASFLFVDRTARFGLCLRTWRGLAQPTLLSSCRRKRSQLIASANSRLSRSTRSPGRG